MPDNDIKFGKRFFCETAVQYAISWSTWAVAVLITFFSFKLDEPMMCKYRTKATLLCGTMAIVLIIRSFKMLKKDRRHYLKAFEQALLLLVLLGAMVVMSHDAVLFQYKKRVVLTTPVDLLNRLGRHFIIGYRAPEQIQQLVHRRAIGGIYITARNIGNKTVEKVRQEVRQFQSIASRNKMPPLFIAADQEGGNVSRLSPLLKAMPSLSSVVDSTSANTWMDDWVKTYAAIQAEQLAALGVNLNLSPVVDLKTDRLRHKLNIRSRIDQRAISADIQTVTKVATIYCTTLVNHGVRPTLKHFPGLGSVSQDTHFRPGVLDGSKQFLEHNDWRPFRETIAVADPFIMIGHVRVPAVDPIYPASLSPAIITGIIRNEWKFNGILITDDFNMGAIAGRKEGIGRSAVRAINAGIDLILLSYDGSQYFNAMYAMIKAYQKGALDLSALSKSDQRLIAFKAAL
jgi:beta-N-acetylhexosaminidase